MRPATPMFLYDAADRPTPLVDSLPSKSDVGRTAWVGAAASAMAPLFPQAQVTSQAVQPADYEKWKMQAEQEGLRLGQQKLEAVQLRYVQSIASLEGAIRTSGRPEASEVVALALVVARELLGRELTVDRQPLVTTVEDALSTVDNDAAARLRLSASDFEYINRQRPDLIGKGVRFVVDSRLAVGGCVVESAQRVVDFSIEKRLDAVREALTAMLEDPAARQDPDAAPTGTTGGG